MNETTDDPEPRRHRVASRMRREDEAHQFDVRGRSSRAGWCPVIRPAFTREYEWLVIIHLIWSALATAEGMNQ
jgi:hypothetical protein